MNLLYTKLKIWIFVFYGIVISNSIVENMYGRIMQNIDHIVKSSLSIYVIWILLHYITPHLYVHFCVPLTLRGFIMSPFIAPSPHCQALRWAIYNGGNTIIAMWVVLGTWIMQKLIATKTNNS